MGTVVDVVKKRYKNGITVSVDIKTGLISFSDNFL